MRSSNSMTQRIDSSEAKPTSLLFVLKPYVLIGASWLLACSSETGSANLATELDSADVHVVALEAELGRHDAAIQAASAIADLEPEEEGHRQSAMTHMDEISRRMGRMTQMCQHMQERTPLNTERMLEVMRAMHEECERHRAEMTTLIDLGGARVLEQKHQNAMRDQSGRMRENMESMRQRADHFHCDSMHLAE